MVCVTKVYCFSNPPSLTVEKTKMKPFYCFSDPPSLTVKKRKWNHFTVLVIPRVSPLKKENETILLF